VVPPPLDDDALEFSLSLSRLPPRTDRLAWLTKITTAFTR
jgi:hypothetical protein